MNRYSNSFEEWVKQLPAFLDSVCGETNSPHEGQIDFCLVLVYVGQNDSGPVFEELPALHIEGNTYELLRSPGLALNLAKGDIIQIPGNPEPAKVLKRGGNFCVQLYDCNIEHRDYIVETVRDKLAGSLDGMKDGNLSFSISSSNSMTRINLVFDALKSETGTEWYYSNIYEHPDDPDDCTLLDWWK
jgi:hypothetical protein